MSQKWAIDAITPLPCRGAEPSISPGTGPEPPPRTSPKIRPKKPGLSAETVGCDEAPMVSRSNQSETVSNHGKSYEILGSLKKKENSS